MAVRLNADQRALDFLITSASSNERESALQAVVGRQGEGIPGAGFVGVVGVQRHLGRAVFELGGLERFRVGRAELKCP